MSTNTAPDLDLFGERDPVLYRVITTNGSEQIRCFPPVPNKPHLGRKDPDLWRIMRQLGYQRIEDIPIHRTNVGGVCGRCRSLGVEVHHIAPRYIFHDVADEYPVVSLCRNCHEQFHETLAEYIRNQVDDELAAIREKMRRGGFQL